MERLQGIVTRPHRLRPAQSSKVGGAAGWAGPGAEARGVWSCLTSSSRPPRSPATTAPSSRAAWSRCCCWDRAGRRVPGAVYQHVSRRGAGTGKGMRAQGPRWGGGRPSQLAELPAPRLGSKDVHAGGRVRPAWKQPSGPPWIGSAWLTCSGARPGVDRGTQGLPQPPPLHPDWGA